MRRSRPISCQTSPGRLLILYEGPSPPFHGYRASLSPLPARQRRLSEQAIISWVIGHADDEHLCGRAVGQPSWRSHQSDDLFVLLKAPRDIARFEERFGVIGFSPLLLL